MLKIYGSSDDLVELEGDHSDEFNGLRNVSVVVGRDEAIAGEDAAGVRVRMAYGDEPGAVWAATISPLDENIAIPWPVRVSARKYTAVVEIDCPKGTPVKVFEDETLVWQDGERVDPVDDDE